VPLHIRRGTDWLHPSPRSPRTHGRPEIPAAASIDPPPADFLAPPHLPTQLLIFWLMRFFNFYTLTEEKLLDVLPSKEKLPCFSLWFNDVFRVAPESCVIRISANGGICFFFILSCG
jgi:hypothetical protein